MVTQTIAVLATLVGLLTFVVKHVRRYVKLEKEHALLIHDYGILAQKIRELIAADKKGLRNTVSQLNETLVEKQLLLNKVKQDEDGKIRYTEE